MRCVLLRTGVTMCRSCVQVPYMCDSGGEESFGSLPALLMPIGRSSQGEHCPSIEPVRLVQREIGRRNIRFEAGGSVTLTARDGGRTRESSDGGGPGVHRVHSRHWCFVPLSTR